MASLAGMASCFGGTLRLAVFFFLVMTLTRMYSIRYLKMFSLTALESESDSVQSSSLRSSAHNRTASVVPLGGTPKQMSNDNKPSVTSASSSSSSAAAATAKATENREATVELMNEPQGNISPTNSTSDPLPVEPPISPSPSSTSEEMNTTSSVTKSVYNVKNIFYLHIPKTGSSFFTPLYVTMCPRVLNDPLNEEAIFRTKPVFEQYFLKSFPPEEWCVQSSLQNITSDGDDDVSLTNVTTETKFFNMPKVGFHHPYSPENLENQTKQIKYNATILHPNFNGSSADTFTTVTMFREPLIRLKSAYSFGFHGSQIMKKLANSVPGYKNMTREELEVLHPFEEYIKEPYIPNCQTKMVLGYQCFPTCPGKKIPDRKEPSEYLDLNLALERINSPNFFFGLTGRWEESMCLLHAWYSGGSPVQSFELLNNRPTKLRAKEKANERNSSIPEDFEYTDLDTILFANASALFEQRVRAAGCLKATESS